MTDPSYEPTFTLTHDTIGSLENGAIGLTINRRIAEAMSDCAARPGLSKKRKVTIQIELEPLVDNLDEGQPGLKEVAVQVQAKAFLPPHAGGKEVMLVKSRKAADGQKIVEAQFPQAIVRTSFN